MTATSKVLRHVPGLVARVALLGLAVAMVQPTIALQRAPRHSWTRPEQASGGAQRVGVGGAGTDWSELAGFPVPSRGTNLHTGSKPTGISAPAGLVPSPTWPTPGLLAATIPAEASQGFGSYLPAPAFARPPPRLS